MKGSETASRAGGGSHWRATLSATCALFVGIGLARFAYTPLIPALVAAQWFGPSDAAYLGAANLAGYLVGAVVARPLASPFPAAAFLRWAMGVAAASFFACAVPLPFLWFFLWRFVSGAAGAVLMVLAAPTVLPHVPAARRGFAGGVIFTGVGLGIAASGSLVPLLVRGGIAVAWCGLGTLAVGLTVAAWLGWPDTAVGATATSALEEPLHAKPVLRGLYIAYALNAVGLVPHMVFLVDFVARGLSQGLAVGARYWVLFGLAALVGPVMLGRIADRIGFAVSVRLAYALQAATILLLAATHGPVALMLSSAVIGAFLPGITALVLGRARELVPHDIERQKAAWSFATLAFALGQAAGAYGFAYLFALRGSYALLFALGGGAVALSLAIDLWTARR